MPLPALRGPTSANTLASGLQPPELGDHTLLLSHLVTQLVVLYSGSPGNLTPMAPTSLWPNLLSSRPSKYVQALLLSFQFPWAR